MVVINGDTGIRAVQSGAVTFEDMPSGSVIQVANYTTGARATGTALIPYDNTIPQITEGTQFMSLSFTPKKANSLLKISVVAYLSNSVNNAVVLSLFDGASDALGCGIIGSSAAGDIQCHSFTVVVPSVSTASKTYTVRAGGVNAGTTTFNLGAYFNGKLASSITIEEIAQ